MSSPVARMVPRRPVQAPPARTSAHVRADLDAVGNEASSAGAEIARLSGLTRDILRSGDDGAHERHEAEIARLQRVTARAEQRREDLTAELRIHEAREAEAAQAGQRERAEAAVKAVVGRIGEGYAEPAAVIATFLAEWSQAERLAKAAGVPGPAMASGRNATRTAITSPEHQEPFQAYLGEDGEVSVYPHPYRGDGTIDRSRTRELRTFYRTVPASTEYRGGHTRTALPDLVSLPRVAEDGSHHGDAARNRASRL